MTAPVRVTPAGPRFAPFWAGCAAGELLVTQCARCRTWHWYPPLGCARCGGDRMVWADAGRTGTVFSYTVAHRGFLPPGAAEVPYAVALVELDDAPGVRLLANLADLGAAGPAVGLRVRAAFRPAGGHTVAVFTPEGA